MGISFVVDSNAGKLARWLRMIGYDTLFFRDIDDGQLVELALREGRVLVTRDTQIARRRVAENGSLRVVLTRDDDPRRQLRHVMQELGLDWQGTEFSRCLECNRPLAPRGPEEVRDLVPPFVFRTQARYTQCPSCGRVYWHGTHWQSMKRALEEIRAGTPGLPRCPGADRG